MSDNFEERFQTGEAAGRASLRDESDGSFESNGSAESDAAAHVEQPQTEDLPPVEPPSAGFIVQLFLVPGLIVLAIIGVWALFGQLSASDQDWRKLVEDVRSANEHRRWRGAFGLAQMLKAGQTTDGEDGGLTANPQVAAELATLFRKQLNKSAPTEDDLKHQAFLARTMGLLDVPQTTLPVLTEAAQPEHDRETRKNAVASIAMIAGRAQDKGEPLMRDDVVDRVIDVSTDSDPLLRQLAAYTLGLLPTADAKQRLRVLLNDADRSTRLNAALALARNNSTAGYPIFKKTLERTEADIQQSDEHVRDAADPTNAGGDAPADSRQFSEFVALKNTLKAIEDLSDRFDDQRRRELIELLGPIAEKHEHTRICVDARRTLNSLDEND